MKFAARLLRKVALPNTHLISLQEAQDRKLFGPVYHGTTEDRRQQIDTEGFKVFDEGEGERNGYSAYQGFYYDNIPAPIHHLGYGVYFTTSPTIAKQYNENSTRGMRTYYLDIPNMETINFAAPKTMMKWWVQNGYDPALARKDRVAATKNLTNNLKSHWDAVWFKGKTIRKALDGDQICVYDPNRIYEISASLAKPGEVGSKVRRKVDGMKGLITGRRQRGDVEGGVWLQVKWQKGGTDYNVQPDAVEFL